MRLLILISFWFCWLHVDYKHSADLAQGLNNRLNGIISGPDIDKKIGRTDCILLASIETYVSKRKIKSLDKSSVTRSVKCFITLECDTWIPI